MSTNISKKKREDLLDKIKQIRAFIAAAPQDENTGNLLSYLSELEKDVNGKKYGLVFEEHREEIDEVLDTHTPVLTEEADLFIDHGGQMNFLLEGDKDGFCPISLAYTTDYCVEVYPFNSTGGESCWRWSTKLLSENINSNTQFSNVVARAKRDGTFNIYEKYRKTTYKAKSIWLETDVITEKGTVELGELGLSERFPFPKPLFLLKKCLQIGTNSNDIILDFFAGSGTTGHAVMKLNAEDGGTRRFILCTNNENGICRDVTYERIRRVIDKEDYAASLKYYKVDYVPISDRMYYEYADELLRHIRELVELENGINFTGNEEIAIVLTDEELEIFLDDEGICKKCRKLYMGHDVLLDAQQAQALQEYNIAVNVIPDYYYKELEG